MRNLFFFTGICKIKQAYLNVLHINTKDNEKDKDKPMTLSFDMGQAHDTCGGV